MGDKGGAPSKAMKEATNSSNLDIKDLSKINNELGYVSKWTFQPGLKSFLDWTSQQPLNNIGFSESLDELTNKGLLKKPIKNNS